MSDRQPKRCEPGDRTCVDPCPTHCPDCDVWVYDWPECIDCGWVRPEPVPPTVTLGVFEVPR